MKPSAIPGIHNYCDRWCERCSFTARCSIYEGTKKFSRETTDIEDQAFWSAVVKNFQQAINFLNTATERHGIDLTNIPSQEIEQINKLTAQVEKDIENNALYRIAFEYAALVPTFYKDDNTIIQTGLSAISDQVSMGLLPEKEATRRLNDIKDCLEVIDWYADFIAAKINRALAGKLGGGVQERDLQHDSNGNAKIASIAIERSIHAWLSLYKLIPELEDRSLKMLATLEKVKKLTEQEFPNTSKFIRPGFDEASS